jgi:hypothetical protein
VFADAQSLSDGYAIEADGRANPTLTLVALALRLADHVKKSGFS